MAGEGNHHLLAHARLVGKARTRGIHALRSGLVPPASSAAVRTPSSAKSMRSTSPCPHRAARPHRVRSPTAHRGGAVAVPGDLTMVKRTDKHVPEPRATGPGTGDDELVAARLRRYLQLLGMTYTLDQFDTLLAWGSRGRGSRVGSTCSFSRRPAGSRAGNGGRRRRRADGRADARAVAHARGCGPSSGGSHSRSSPILPDPRLFWAMTTDMIALAC